MAKSNLTAERAIELLVIDDSGDLRWRIRRGRIAAGSLAEGADRDGYRTIYIDYRRYFSHRVRHLMKYGEWPKGMIDHKDGDPKNNDPENLRVVTSSVNSQNRRRARSNTSVGMLGVSTSRHTPNRPYRATIVIDGHQKYLGCYPTPEAAHEAYVAAKRIYHPGNML